MRIGKIQTRLVKFGGRGFGHCFTRLNGSLTNRDLPRGILQRLVQLAQLLLKLRAALLDGFGRRLDGGFVRIDRGALSFCRRNKLVVV